MELQFILRYEKFRDSLHSLSKINELVWPDDENTFGFIWCGVISIYCITFDLSYKLMKDILVEYHGNTNFAKGSPREILREAFQANMISNDDWLDMLKSRNEIVHQYQEYDHVNEWCRKIIDVYIPLFHDIECYALEILEKNKRKTN